MVNLIIPIIVSNVFDLISARCVQKKTPNSDVSIIHTGHDNVVYPIELKCLTYLIGKAILGRRMVFGPEFNIPTLQCTVSIRT